MSARIDRLYAPYYGEKSFPVTKITPRRVYYFDAQYERENFVDRAALERDGHARHWHDGDLYTADGLVQEKCKLAEEETKRERAIERYVANRRPDYTGVRIITGDE